METPALQAPTFTPATEGRPLPEDAYAFLQEGARVFSAHDLAPFAPVWLPHMAQALARQGRERILTRQGAEQINDRLGELQCCYADVWVVQIIQTNKHREKLAANQRNP